MKTTKQALLYAFIVGLILCASATQSFARDKKDDKLPSFVSIGHNEANVRAGPGTQYPILWVYKQKGYPLEVLAKYQGWYKTRDAEGEEGWLYKTLISHKRTVMVSAGEPIKFYKYASGAKPMYLLAPRVLLTLDECTETMCEVSYKKTTGWVDKTRLLMLDKDK